MITTQTEFCEENEGYQVIAVTDKGTIFKGPFDELIWMETENTVDVPIGEILTCADGKLWQ